MKTSVNGIGIGYDDLGPADARAVIFLHGFPFNRTMWRSQMQRLAGRCRVIACDLRGYGETETGEAAFSMELFTNDLLGLMDALRIERAVLCGISLGGCIALEAAERRPERFSALILCGCRCSADTPEEQARKLAAVKAIKDEGVPNFAEALLGRLFAPKTYETAPEVVAAVRTMMLQSSPLSLERTLLAMRVREETCSKLPELRMPVLLLVGETDGVTPPENAAYMKEHFPHAHLSVIPGTGHLSNLENPDAFNAELERFIAAL